MAERGPSKSPLGLLNVLVISRPTLSPAAA
jgi:hypothetical protein